MVALDKIWGGLQTVIMMDEILRPKKMVQKDREKSSVGFIAVVGRSPQIFIVSYSVTSKMCF